MAESIQVYGDGLQSSGNGDSDRLMLDTASMLHCLNKFLGHSWISSILYQITEPLPCGRVVLTPSIYPVLHHLNPTITSISKKLRIPAIQHIGLQVQQQSKLPPPSTDPVHKSKLMLTSFLLPLKDNKFF